MNRLYTYKFRLNPSQEQQVLLNKHFGCCRFVFNHFLGKRINTYKTEKKSLNRRMNEADIPALKKENPFLTETGSQSLQYSVECLQNSYDNFFRKVKLKKQGKHKGKCGFPRFKRKHGRQSFRVKQNIHLIDGKLKFPKFLEGIELIQEREVEGEIQFATISRSPAGHYDVAITVFKNIDPLPEAEKTIGIDLNIGAMVDSDGNYYKNPRPAQRYKKRLKLLHQAVSRSVKGTKGREQAKKKLAKLYEHIHNVREDFLHKLSTQIVRENQTICLEDLDVAGMLRKTKPEDRIEHRWEEKVRHRNISDCGFYSFVQKLTYKAEWYGRLLKKVDRWFPSSQLCSVCDYRNKDLTLADRTWVCPICGAVHDRDENSATNIHNEGTNPSWNRGRAVRPGVRPVVDGLLVGTETSPL